MTGDYGQTYTGSHQEHIAILHVISGVRSMRCERCQNLMVQVPLLDEGGGVTDDPAWRCVACGHVIDAVIARHRRAAQPRAKHHDTVRPRVPMAVTVGSMSL